MQYFFRGFSLFSQSSDRLVSSFTSGASTHRQQHTVYVLQAPPTNSLNNASRHRVRDRKNQPSSRHPPKSASASNTTLDDQSELQPSQMRSLDRRHVRAMPHNSSVNSSISKTHMKSSHTDIYGSLERNKHSKASQPTLHGTALNDENDRINKSDNQAHDFYHLTSTLPTQTSIASTIVNVGNALYQQQQFQNQTTFDNTDSVPSPVPTKSSANRSRRPLPSVFQPHFDSSASTAAIAPKDSYYTISTSKDASTHPHVNVRGLVADNFYNGPYMSKPPVAPLQQQHQQAMRRCDTSPLLVRRLEHLYPSETRHQSQSYNRTQSGSILTTSHGPTGRLNATNHGQPSALLFRPHSSQSSSSQSSG